MRGLFCKKKKTGDVIEDRGLIYPTLSHFQSVRALSCVPVLCTHSSEMLMGSPNILVFKKIGTLYFRYVHMYVLLEWYLHCNPGGSRRGGGEIDFIEFADSINSHNPIEREQMFILILYYLKWIPRRPAVHRTIHTRQPARKSKGEI